MVCMDEERGMLYVPCNHLVVCVECETDMAARPMDCSYYQEPIDEARSKRGHHDGCGVIEGKSERGRDMGREGGREGGRERDEAIMEAIMEAMI